MAISKNALYTLGSSSVNASVQNEIFFYHCRNVFLSPLTGGIIGLQVKPTPEYSAARFLQKVSNKFISFYSCFESICCVKLARRKEDTMEKGVLKNST
jgi:hypothetical protein